MTTYIIRRSLIGLLTLFLITFVVFGLIRNMPGNPMVVNMAESDPSKKISKEDQQRMLALYGLDKPWYQSYFIWMNNVRKGDLGRSIVEKEPVPKGEHRSVRQVLDRRRCRPPGREAQG